MNNIVKASLRHRIRELEGPVRLTHLASIDFLYRRSIVSFR
jgi:hypothetical protein